jgi:ATP-dependent Clp endopeptidase proteolytic subunit ClpP
MPKNQPFYAWIDDGDTPTLAIDGVIDTGSDWYSDAVTPKAFRAALDAHDGQDIIVSINSPGGDVFAGFEIYNMLAARKGGTTVRVMGLAASAASYIAMAADPGKLQMCRASMMMIHNPWSWAYGNAEEMRKQAEVLDAIGSVMVDIYMQRATCAEEELRAMLDAERYLSPTEALNAGLCDEIIDPAEEDDDEETQAMAALRDRYVAMSVEDVRRVRSALHIAPRKAAEKSPKPNSAGDEDKNDYLAMADALIADM